MSDQRQPSKVTAVVEIVKTVRAFVPVVVILLLLGGGFMILRAVKGSHIPWPFGQSITTVSRDEVFSSVSQFRLISWETNVQTSTTLTRCAAAVNNSCLPGMSRQVDLVGQVRVQAGSDLNGVTKNDVQVTQRGGRTHVVVTIPGSQVTSSEVDLQSISFACGLQAVWCRQEELMLEAGPQLRASGVARARESGLIQQADRAAAVQLQTFLENVLGQDVDVMIITGPPPAQPSIAPTVKR